MASQQHRFVYGTSGFRAEASKLPLVVRRSAFYAAVRARMFGEALGMMITASHNPAQDNGIKLVEPDGRMLPMDCERELTELVNSDEQAFAKYAAEKMAQIANESDEQDGRGAVVVIATDTRPSSPELLSEALLGIQMLGAGLVKTDIFERHTTPQLHFIVRATKDDQFSGGYVSRFRGALAASFELIPFDRCTRYTKKLVVDCANGVGALWVAKYLGEISEDEIVGIGNVVPVEVELLNAQVETGELLNYQCGADFVKIEAQLPTGFDRVPQGTRCASLDGDADRLVYFYQTDEGRQVALLDGDHIGALFAHFIIEQFNAASQLGKPIPLSFGIVQTAYANGNSTRYFHRLGLQPILAKTGVKHLEEAAHKFDVGLYFETNGHGTVCFSDKFHLMMKAFQDVEKAKRPRYIRLLALFSQLVNEVVGDGIANLLAVECLLRHFDWSIQDWEANTYRNMPSVQLKVPVQDRSVFTTAEDNETQLIRPEGMQAQIDKITAEFPLARAFVRPSGTEQIVRVYAETQTQAEAIQLAERLAQLIRENQPAE